MNPVVPNHLAFDVSHVIPFTNSRLLQKKHSGCGSSIYEFMQDTLCLSFIKLAFALPSLGASEQFITFGNCLEKIWWGGCGDGKSDGHNIVIFDLKLNIVSLLLIYCVLD